MWHMLPYITPLVRRGWVSNQQPPDPEADALSLELPRQEFGFIPKSPNMCFALSYRQYFSCVSRGSSMVFKLLIDRFYNKRLDILGEHGTVFIHEILSCFCLIKARASRKLICYV